MLGDNALRNPLEFFVELVRQPVWIPIWVLFLMIVHIASVGFWHEPVARLIFANFLMSAMLMMGLYSRFGFEKILGLGHISWIPVLVYLLTQIPTAEPASNATCLCCLSQSRSLWCSIRLMSGNTSHSETAPSNQVERIRRTVS